MPKRSRNGVGQSDRQSSAQSGFGECSSDVEPLISGQGAIDTRAFGSLHPHHLDSSLLDISQEILKPQYTHVSSASLGYGECSKHEKSASKECTSVLLRLFSITADQNTPPRADNFGSKPNLAKSRWFPTRLPASLSRKPLHSNEGVGRSSPSSSTKSTPPRRVLEPIIADNQIEPAVLQSVCSNIADVGLVCKTVSRMSFPRHPCQPLHSPSSQSRTCMRSLSPKSSCAQQGTSHQDVQQSGSEADGSLLLSDRSLCTRGIGSPVDSTSTAVSPMASRVSSINFQSPTKSQLHPLHLVGSTSLHRQLPSNIGMPATGSPAPNHSPQRMAASSFSLSGTEQVSACAQTALFADHLAYGASPRDMSAPCDCGSSRITGIMHASAQPAQVQDSAVDYSETASQAVQATPQQSAGAGAQAPARPAAKVSSVTSGRKPPVREVSFFGPQTVGASSSPHLAYATIVLLAISGVMGLAHCSAFITILLDGRTPDSPVLSYMLLGAEAIFAASCCLQWWLVAGADRMFDCLKWAGNPSGSLPMRAARSLVLSTAHKFTWFALVGQLVASVMLVAVITVDIAFPNSTYNLVPYLMCFARVTILTCNYILIYEALQSWVPLPLVGAHALQRCIASDAELLFLLSCALYCVWELLDILGVAGNSGTQTVVIVGVCLGGGALARTFGASLLLWARNSALRDQTVEERKLRAMLTNWYVQPECTDNNAEDTKTNSTGTTNRRAKATPQQYIDASAVATRLMVPDTLPRALSLQNLASCGAVLVLLLNVAQQLSKRTCHLDSYLVHMFHILTAGAEIVQNHNQRRCVSLVYVACDEGAQDNAQRHLLMVQQLHPQHVDRLPGHQRLDAKRMQQVKLKLTHVIPMLLDLDSKLSGTARRVFDDEGPAASGVKVFAMQSSQVLNNYEESGISNSTPIAHARSSHMQSCDARSSTQRTPWASSTAIVPTPGTSSAGPGVTPSPPPATNEGKQKMKWALVKGLTEAQSPGTPAALRAGPPANDTRISGKPELDMKSESGGSMTKWEPLPCLPSQIVAGYAFVIDGPVAPEIGSSSASAVDAGNLWPSITAVELTVESIKAIYKAKNADIRHDSSLVRTESMDALVQVHVVPSGEEADMAWPAGAANRHTGRTNSTSGGHKASNIGMAAAATPWASGQQVEQMMQNLGVSSVAQSMQAPLPGEDAQAAVQAPHAHSSNGQPDANTQSPDGDTDPLATPKAFSVNHTMFSTSRPPTSLVVGQSTASAVEAGPSSPPQQAGDEVLQKPAHNKNTSISSPWDPSSQDLANHVWPHVENNVKPDSSAGGASCRDSSSSASDNSSRASSSSESGDLEKYRSSSNGALPKLPVVVPINNRTSASSSIGSQQHEEGSSALDFFLPLPPGAGTQ